MKKNVIWWPALENPEHSDKYGGFDYFEYSDYFEYFKYFEGRWK